MSCLRSRILRYYCWFLLAYCNCELAEYSLDKVCLSLTFQCMVRIYVSILLKLDSGTWLALASELWIQVRCAWWSVYPKIWSLQDQLFSFPCFHLLAEGMVADDRGSLILGPWASLTWGRLLRWACKTWERKLCYVFFFSIFNPLKKFCFEISTFKIQACTLITFIFLKVYRLTGF